MRVLFDTNVLVAAFVSRGHGAELFEHCVRAHQPMTSPPILEELKRALSGKLRLSARDAEAAVKLVRERFTLVEIAEVEPVCRDRDDDHVLGAAIAGSCDVLVTGDKDLLALREYAKIPILAPAAFWAFEIGAEEGGHE